MDPIVIILVVAVLFCLAFLKLHRRKGNIMPIEPTEELPQEEDATQEEDVQQESQEPPQEETAERLIYENYVEGRFSHLLAIAIKGVVSENSPTVSAIEKALGPRNNYRQSTAYLDHLLNAGVVVEDSYQNRKVAITPGQARCIIIPKLMNYPAEWGVSQVVEQLRRDVEIMLADFWSEIDTMEGTEFEDWCMKLLEKLGFERVEGTKVSGDQGVDILAVKEEIPYAFQCKCWAYDLGNTSVQEVYAGMRFYNRNVGVVITNRYFTKGAKDLARACGVLLWDRETLKRLLAKTESQRCELKKQEENT